MIRLARGGLTQDEVARVEHVSKRTVGECARVARERALTADELGSMSDEAVDALFPKAQGRRPSLDRLQPDMAALVERKKRNRKLPLLIMWTEHVQEASERGMVPYAYSTFCQMFAEEADRVGATRHFNHVPGAKAFIDWCGDVAHLTDALTGKKTPVYVIVVELPFSNKFWAEGFLDMKQDSWLEGHIHAFEYFGGVPSLLVPDNCATATNRKTPKRTTTLNEEYERFADHYRTGILPTRVRKPRDKSTSETAVNLVETWIIPQSEEMTIYTLDEFNDFCADRVAWLNARPYSAKDGSRDSVFEEEERGELLPLPPERYERCKWKRCKVAPDYHVIVDYMRYSVPHRLVGATVDVKASSTKVTVYHGGEQVAVHNRLHGRRSQYSTFVEHMPEAHAALSNPWSRERFEDWARRIGSETDAAIRRLMDRTPIVQQSFTPVRNILGLSKTFSPELLERACARPDATGMNPTYWGLKRDILALRAKDEEGASISDPSDAAEAADEDEPAIGLTRGADAYRIGGGE
jgi:transposase